MLALDAIVFDSSQKNWKQSCIVKLCQCGQLSGSVAMTGATAVGLKSDRTDDRTPGGRYATGHCPVWLSHAMDIWRDTGPWRCSSDETVDETRL